MSMQMGYVVACRDDILGHVMLLRHPLNWMVAYVVMPRGFLP